MSLTDVATLYTTHGKTLVAANIRNYKGSTEVNDQILATICDEPENFFYLNNGLTAYCERFEVNNLDRGDTQRKRLKAYGFSIVNGCGQDTTHGRFHQLPAPGAWHEQLFCAGAEFDRLQQADNRLYTEYTEIRVQRHCGVRH